MENYPVALKLSDSTTIRVGVRIEYGEMELREKAKHLGAIWRPRHKLWEMGYDDALVLGLAGRVAA